MVHFPQTILAIFLGGIVALPADDDVPKEQFIDPEPGAPDPEAVVKEIKQLNDDEYELGQIRFNKKTGEIRFPAKVNQNEVLLEFAIVNEVTGKTHEALLSTPISPLYLAIVFKLMRFEESERDIWPVWDEDGNIVEPMKDDGKGRLDILVEREVDGKKERFPIGDWIYHRRRNESLKPGHWVLTGSEMYRGYYLAETDGAIAAIYRTTAGLINSFDDSSDNDEVWFPHLEKVPELGTEVDVVIAKSKKTP
ncbi:MAG: YdjY domain-containing protein [Verrucomicrobiota bacterium]